MKSLPQLLHHRSLTASVLALFFGLLALGCIPHHEIDRSAWLLQAGPLAVLGVTYCVLNLVLLLRDERSGYESFRLSVATLLWALACFPVLVLTLGLVGTLLKSGE